MKTEEYFKDSQLSVDVFKKKYMIDSEEYLDAVKRVVYNIADIELYEEDEEGIKLRDLPNEEIFKKVEYWRKRWVKEIVEDIWKPAGSIMAGVGNPVKGISAMNCTTVSINGDTLEDIADARYKLMKFAAYRQGIGVDFAPLRPAGSKVMNSARVSYGGAINWMEDFNEAAKHVGQAGRIPALLFSIHDTHPDFPEFITLKSDLKKIENANISVQLSDEFMQAVENDADWLMWFNTPYETIKRREKAKELYKKILENNLNFSEPGIQFRDTIHKYSNSDYVGWPVVSSNACSEKFLDPSGACNLASFNLEKFPIDLDELDKFLEHYMPSLVRFLDNVITYEEYSGRNPIDEQRISQRMLRRIGIGFTNLHAWFLKAGVDYGSQESIELAEELMKRFMYHAYKASIELGKEKGSFGAFDRKKFEQSPYVKEMMKMGLEFEAMRNVELISIAPTGSLSTMISKPVFSYGIEPAFGLYYWKRTRISGKYEYYFIVPSVVYDILKENGIDLKKYGLEKLVIKDTFDGKYGKPIAQVIDSYRHLFNFKPAKEIKPEDKVKLMDTIAKYVDASISTTYILPENAKKEDVDKIVRLAWKHKIKSVSIYRDATRYGIVEFVPFKERVEQLHKQGFTLHKHELSDEDIKLLDFNPFGENISQKEFTDKIFMKVVNGGDNLAKIIKFKAEGGDKFYVILRLDEKEIFITNYKIENRSNEHILAIANRLGNLVKQVDEKAYYKQLERSENTLNRFTRMLSTALKLGLKEQALKILNEYATVGNLAWYLTKKVFHYYEKHELTCPQCGMPTLVDNGEGCFSCTNCDYEKCG